MFKSGLKYKMKAVNAHSIHSPFVFEFYNEVLKKSKKGAQPQIEERRKQLLADQSVIEITDFGAGSKIHSSNKRKISELTKYAAVSKKYGQLLRRIIDFYELNNSLELGTSLGIGTAYIAALNSEVTTLEGCRDVTKKARESFELLGLKNIKVIEGEFDKSFKELNDRIFDLIYIDGNHTEEATINYFNKFLKHAHNDTFLIFDDIRWSEGMERAWTTIIESQEINVSIELLRMGIVLKRQEQTKQHFILKF